MPSQETIVIVNDKHFHQDIKIITYDVSENLFLEIRLLYCIRCYEDQVECVEILYMITITFFSFVFLGLSTICANYTYND